MFENYWRGWVRGFWVLIHFCIIGFLMGILWVIAFGPCYVLGMLIEMNRGDGSAANIVMFCAAACYGLFVGVPVFARLARSWGVPVWGSVDAVPLLKAQAEPGAPAELQRGDTERQAAVARWREITGQRASPAQETSAPASPPSQGIVQGKTDE
jgi:hypothetical protein